MSKTSLHCIEGTILSISHIFYLSGTSKTFFLQLNESDDEKDEKSTFVMARLSEVRTKDLPKVLVEMQLNFNKFVGKKVIVQNLTKTILKTTNSSSSINVEAYILSKATIVEIKETISKYFQHAKNLVNYEGIVTDDHLVNCGLFILDNKVVVCQSTLCVITNIRRVKLGMKVALNNVHTKKLKKLGKVGLIFCSKGRLDILEDPQKGELITSMHSNETDLKLFEDNQIILHLFCSVSNAVLF